MGYLDISGLRKAYPGGTGVHLFDLVAEPGEFVSLLGPSGCGKTTALRMVAGFERPDGGSIRIGGRDVTDVPASKRNIGMVFQAYALFPNMTVAQNIGFGLRLAKSPRREIDARVEEMLGLIRLGEHAQKFPFQLSGGQQQRVALARALAGRPSMLLLDEPLSALDAKIRVALREEIRAVQKRLGVTTLFVTHDQEEALSISDRIVVMNAGRIEQVGTPFEIYNRPQSRFVAQFVGAFNFLDGTIDDPAAGLVTLEGLGGLRLDEAQGIARGERVTIALRPEAIGLGPGAEGDNRLEGTLEAVSFQGSVVRLQVVCGPVRLQLDRLNRTDAPPPRPGSPVMLSFGTDARLLRDAGVSG